MKGTFLATAIFIGMAISSTQAMAVGAYVELPLQLSLKNCSQDCSPSPEGFIAGAMIDNLGIGLGYYIANQNDAIPFQQFRWSTLDVTYLLPIPVVNVSVGAGMVFVAIDNKVAGTYSGGGYQMILKAGYQVIPFLDIHGSYYSTSATVDFGSQSTDVSSSLIALGVTLSF